jgi:hypothetical protein
MLRNFSLVTFISLRDAGLLLLIFLCGHICALKKVKKYFRMAKGVVISDQKKEAFANFALIHT